MPFDAEGFVRFDDTGRPTHVLARGPGVAPVSLVQGDGIGDALARGRTAPAGLPTLPMTLQSVGGVGRCVASYGGNAIQAAIGTYGNANTGIYYLKPSTGSDANPGTLASPFATIAQAMRTASGAASRIVCLEDMVLPPFDLRSTDASQTEAQFKWLDANSFNVIIREGGPDLSALTWVQDGTLTNCYKCDLSANGLSAGQVVTRVLRTDVLDSYGFHRQFKVYTSSAALNTAGSGEKQGMYWDNAGRLLWLNMGAGSVQAARAVLKGLFTGTSGVSRILAYGASVGFSGVRFEGVQLLQLDQGGRRARHVLHNCTQAWSPSKGCDMTEAGDYLASNTTVYASQADCVNAFAPSPATGAGLIFTINCRFIRAGDCSVFAQDGTLQGVSAHGGSHHVSWGSQFLDCNGQGVADTCINGATGDVSWLVACAARPAVESAAAASYEFGSAATGAMRAAYLDMCDSPMSPTADLKANANSTVYAYLGNLVTRTGTVLDYTPA